MSAEFARRLLGWKLTKNSLVPNAADVASASSMAIAGATLDQLGVARGEVTAVPKDPGRPLEVEVAAALRGRLPEIDSERPWFVPTGEARITDFVQYRHLLDVDDLAASPALRITLGRDYMIKPDVCVGLEAVSGVPFLQAAVSCKWSIRSDRVQNIRHENNQMIRHRRARLPHLVTVTAEPQPSRLISIARGTGEVDAVYHIAFEEMRAAVHEVGNQEQQNDWDECVGQGRLLPFDALAETIARW